MPKTTKSTSMRRTAATRTNARRRNSMKNNRNQRFMILVTLLAVALVGTIGVAVAAFSRTLQINGTATVKSTVWDIHFENLSETPTIVGEKAKEAVHPSITTNTNNVAGTAIKDYKVELKDPGDSIEYTFEIVNGGDLDAIVTSVAIRTGTNLTCSSEDDANMLTRNANVCRNLNYTLKYADGTDVAVGDELLHDTGSNRKTVKLKLEFSSNAQASDLPDKDVSVSGLDVVITYGQLTSGN